MQIRFNELLLETTASNLELLLEEKALLHKTGIAVALNDLVIQRARWQATALNEHDTVLVITAAAGG